MDLRCEVLTCCFPVDQWELQLYEHYPYHILLQDQVICLQLPAEVDHIKRQVYLTIPRPTREDQALWSYVQHVWDKFRTMYPDMVLVEQLHLTGPLHDPTWEFVSHDSQSALKVNMFSKRLAYRDHEYEDASYH